MAEYDLTPTISQYLDRHLIFPLLEYLQNTELYNKSDILESKVDLLGGTNMLDFAAEVYQQQLGQDVPANFEERMEIVMGKKIYYDQQCQNILQILSDEELLESLKAEKNFSMECLTERFEITANDLETLYMCAKFRFDCGAYGDVGPLLAHYRHLNNNISPERCFSALWGKLAAEILMLDWEAAHADLFKLRDLIEQRSSVTSPLEQLQLRTWLIHWSLFVFFNHPNGREGLIELWYNEKFLNAITTNCPHVLRYLTTAVIINKRRRGVVKEYVKDLVQIIEQEHYVYHDPITEFMECLYVKFDFDAAEVKLRECETVLKNDYFLREFEDIFMENARLFIFETYCRIHQKLDITMLASKLNMDKDNAEKWIVDLIRHARIDAKIDSQESQVLMWAQHSSIYQQVIDRTKSLTFRTDNLASNVERRLQQIGADTTIPV